MKNDDILNHIKNTKWISIPGLYRLFVTIDEFRGVKNVILDIFRSNIEETPFNAKDLVPETVPQYMLDEEPSYVLVHLKESFTLEEIKKIKSYLRKYKCIKIGKPKLCSIPEDGSIWPTGAHPYDGYGTPTGFIDFYRFNNYNLPFKISGFYDIRFTDFEGIIWKRN